MSAPRLLLFGPPRLAAAGGEGEPLPNERRHQLVAWLALRGSWVGRPEAAALLWPEHEARLAATNLRKALHRLHGSVLAPLLQTQGQALRVSAATDVAAFEAALAEGQLGDAVALRSGELLEGFDDDANQAWTEWLRFERERLRAAWHAATLRFVVDPTTPPAAAVTASARLLAHDPLDEDALAAHLRSLIADGQPTAARQAYRQYAERLHAELGIAPSSALKALHDPLTRDNRAPGQRPAAQGTDASAERRAADASAAPGAALAAVAPGTAADAAADAGFIGRAVELKRLAELLQQPDCALLALLGPGGVGKTRLARRALQALAPGYADGATFVALEDVAEPAEAALRIAAALSLTLAAAGPPLQEVVRALAGQQRLLVLDNFEALAPAAGWLAELHQACPRLKVLITSRVRPAAPGVWTMPLEGLPCAEPEDEAEFQTFDATRLFIRAAQRVEPAFVPATEARAIVDICRLVQGLPLALELAASFTRVLSCAAIAAELREGTELLRATDPARPPRQASLQAVFEQSWRLLAAAEREALARLAVFRGGFAAAAARAVAGATLPVLAALVDKSLLQKDGARLRMHPLVQQLSASKLADAGAASDAAAAHAAHFIGQMAQWRDAALDGRGETLRQIELEFDNCRAAWRHAVAAADADGLARSASALADFCDHRGRLAQGLALLQEALAAAGAAPPAGQARRAELSMAVVRVHAAHLLGRLERHQEAKAMALEVLATAQRCDDHELTLNALNTLGSAAFHQGQLDEAAGYYREHLRRAAPASLPHRAARTLSNLALVEQAAGRLNEARSLFLQAMALHQRLSDPGAEVKCLHNLALLHLASREMAPALSRLQAALALCDRHGLATVRVYVLGGLVEHARFVGDFDAAARHAAAALLQAQALGLRAVECRLHVDFAHIALQRADLGAAQAALARAANLALEIDKPSLVLVTAAACAEALAAAGSEGAACRVLAWAAAHPATSPPEREALLARVAQLREAEGALPADDAPRLAAEHAQATLVGLLRRAAAGADLEAMASAIAVLPTP